MSLHPLRAPDYIEHMIEAVERILTYTRGKSQAEFESDTLLQDAVLRNLGILGEASKNLLADAPDVAKKSPEVPFAKIYGMRNQIEHGYFTVDLGIVWNVIANELPKLESSWRAVLKTLAP